MKARIETNQISAKYGICKLTFNEGNKAVSCSHEEGLRGDFLYFVVHHTLYQRHWNYRVPWFSRPIFFSLAVQNMPTAHFPVFEHELEGFLFLPKKRNCVLTALALRHSVTATLCQCGYVFWSKRSPWHINESPKQFNLIIQWPISTADSFLDIKYALLLFWDCNPVLLYSR